MDGRRRRRRQSRARQAAAGGCCLETAPMQDWQFFSLPGSVDCSAYRSIREEAATAHSRSCSSVGQAHWRWEVEGCRGVCVDGGGGGTSVWVAELHRIWLFAPSIGLDTAGAGCGLCRHTRSPVARLGHRTPWLLHGAGNSYVVGALFSHAADRAQWLAEPGIAELVPCFSFLLGGISLSGSPPVLVPRGPEGSL